MSKQNETGHTKNLANFLKLIECCRGFEKDYNPSTANITLGALQELYDKALKSVEVLNSTETAFNNATNARAIAFENNKPWATRIINAFDISPTNAKNKEDVRGINNKIQGKRVGKIDPKEKGANLPEGEGGKHISVSQLSYDNQKKHFEALLEALVQDGHYNPNEKDITIDAIDKKIDEMANTNKKLNTAETSYNNKLIARDKALYHPETGMLAIVQTVKKYIKSVYTAASPQFKMANALKFKKIES